MLRAGADVATKQRNNGGLNGAVMRGCGGRREVGGAQGSAGEFDGVKADDNEDKDEEDASRGEDKKNNKNKNATTNLIELKFDSQWTGTCKNIEMYSEELQERKNQLEIDIGL